MNSTQLIVLAFFLLLARSTAQGAWYYDVIMHGDIKNAYFAGWNGANCTQIGASALKNVRVPKDYRDSHAEFLEQTCIKGRNDNKDYKGDKRLGEKEVKYLENLFVDRIPLLKAR